MRDSGQGCLCKCKHSQGLEFFSEPQVGKWKRSILWSQPGILNMCGPTAANKWLLSFGDLLASHKTSWGHSAFYSYPRKPWAEQTMGNTTAKHNKYEIWALNMRFYLLALVYIYFQYLFGFCFDGKISKWSSIVVFIWFFCFIQYYFFLLYIILVKKHPEC